MPHDILHESHLTCVFYTLLQYMLTIIKDMDYIPLSELDNVLIMLKNNPSPMDHTLKTIKMLKEKMMEGQHEFEEHVAQH